MSSGGRDLNRFQTSQMPKRKKSSLYWSCRSRLAYSCVFSPMVNVFQNLQYLAGLVLNMARNFLTHQCHTASFYMLTKNPFRQLQEIFPALLANPLFFSLFFLFAFLHKYLIMVVLQPVIWFYQMQLGFLMVFSFHLLLVQIPYALVLAYKFYFQGISLSSLLQALFRFSFDIITSINSIVVTPLTYPKIRTQHPSGYKQYSLVTFLLFLSTRFLAHILF